jgi:hypothetical protein
VVGGNSRLCCGRVLPHIHRCVVQPKLQNHQLGPMGQDVGLKTGSGHIGRIARDAGVDHSDRACLGGHRLFQQGCVDNHVLAGRGRRITEGDNRHLRETGRVHCV